MTWTVNLSNSQLNNLVSSSIADGSYSYQEVLNLLNTVAVGGITLSEWTDLKTVYTNSASLFASDYVKSITYNVIYENPANAYWWDGAKTQLGVEALGNMSGSTTEENAERLVAKWFLGQDVPMPIIGGDTATGLVSEATYDYAFATGQLFVNGAAASDVNQGDAGTCYLVASLGSIANAKPSTIQNSFIDNGNGTYGVKFYLNGSVTYTTINKEVATNQYNRIALSANANHALDGEVWVSLLEKAYAQLNTQADLGEHYYATVWQGENSYQAIEGGLAAPIKQITGLNYKYYGYKNWGNFDPFSAGFHYSSDYTTYKQTIINALNGGSIGYIGSYGTTYDTNDKKNFVKGHAFMLLGYNSATDKFIIRNPWGNSYGAPDWNPQFEASIEEFWNPTVQAQVALSDATLADPVYNYTIASSAANEASAVTEGGSVTFTITRSGSGTASTVFLSTTPGSADASDYQALSKSALSFAANETAQTVTVKTLADSLTEGVERFNLDLFKAVTDTDPATAAAYIKDATTQNFEYTISSTASTAGTAVVEGGKVTFTITRSGSGVASTVYLSATPGTAGAADFQSSNKVALSFAAYETTKTVTVDTFEDVATEGFENFSLDLYKNPGDATKTATSLAYIKDKVLPTYEYTITSNAASPAAAVGEGGKVFFTITRSGSGTESTVFVATAGGTAGGADFVGIGRQAITFLANQTTATVEVQTNEDWWLESVEYFTLNLYKNKTDAVYASSGSAFIKDQPVSTFTYTVTSNSDSSAPVTEGSPVTFTVTRSGSGAASTVYLKTFGGTASDGKDYQSLDRQALEFAANETSKTVTLNTYTDSLIESTEYFWLDVYRNYADGGSTAFGSAHIKDLAAVAKDYDYAITSSAPSTGTAVVEGGVVTFTVTRSGTGSASTVYLSTTNSTTSPGDYQALDKLALSFGANETVKTVSVNTYTDSITEGNELFWLDLYKTYDDAVNANWASYGSAVITDPAPGANYQYTITSHAGINTPATEGGAATFTVTRSGSGTASTVYISTAGGTASAGDFQAMDKVALTFAPNETSKTVSVNTYTDSLIEGKEYFWLDLYKNYTDALTTFSSGYIQDPAATAPDYNYTITSSASPTPVNEGGVVTFTVTRSGSGAASTVYVSTTTGTAGTDDYQSLDKVALSFAVGESSKTVTVNTYTDAWVEGKEYFYLDLYKSYEKAVAFDPDSWGGAYLQDPPAVNYTITNNAASVGAAATEGGAVTFTVTRSASGSASTVYLSTESGTAGNGSDFQGMNKVALSFAAGEASKTVSVNTLTDALTEGTESFALNLYRGSADIVKAATSNAYIKDPAPVEVDYEYALGTLPAPVTEGDLKVFHVLRLGSGTTSTIYFSTAPNSAGTGDFQGMDKVALTFAPDETEKTVGVNTYADALDEGVETFDFQIFRKAADLTPLGVIAASITDPVVVGPQIDYTVTNVIGNAMLPAAEGSPVVFQVTRNYFDTASTVYVSTAYGSAGANDIRGLNRVALTFDPGVSGMAVVVDTLTDALTENDESFRLEVFKDIDDTTATAFDYGTIADPEPANTYTYTVTSNANPTPATEGNPVTFTITRSGSGTASTVYGKTIDGDAKSRHEDFGSIFSDASAIRFAANETVKTVTVDTHPDWQAEGTEHFWLNVYKTQADANSGANGVSALAYIKDPVGDIPAYSYQIYSTASAVVPETEGDPVAFTVTRSGSAIGTPSTVYLSTQAISASAGGGDYVGANKVALSFDAGETTKGFIVNTNLDDLTEGTEAFGLNLYRNFADTAAEWATFAIAYIKDPAPNSGDEYTITSNAPSNAPVIEGGVLTFTITRNGGGTATDIWVDTRSGTAVEEDDYHGLGDSDSDRVRVSFAAGETSKTVLVTTYADGVAEGTENFWLDLYRNRSDVAANKSGQAYIVDPAPVVDAYTYTATSNAFPTAVTEGSPVTFTITRSGSGTASTVYVKTHDGDAKSSTGDFANPGTSAISFAANETVKTFAVNTSTDALAEGTEHFWLQVFKTQADANSGTNRVVDALAYIKDPVGVTPAYAYTITSDAMVTPATEGSPVTFTVTRSGSAIGTPSTVYLSTVGYSASAGDYVAANKVAFSFAAGEQTKGFVVNTNVDALTEGTEAFGLNLYRNLADANTEWATYGFAYIKDPAPNSGYEYTITSDAPSNAPVIEGGVVTFTITRNGSGIASEVYLGTRSGTAVEDQDFSGLGDSDVDRLLLGFADDEISKTVQITTNGDGVTEGTENFWLDLYRNFLDVAPTRSGQAYIQDPASEYTITNNASSIETAIAEGGEVTFTITRINPAAAAWVSVAQKSGTATAGWPVHGADFQEYLEIEGEAIWERAEIAFAPGEISKTYKVLTFNDAVTEGPEYFWLDLYQSRWEVEAPITSSKAYIRDDADVVIINPFALASNPSETPIAGSAVASNPGATSPLASVSSPVVDAPTLSFPGHSAGAFVNDFAFAALKADGSVVTWGYGPAGGNSGAVSSQLNGDIDVFRIYSNSSAFAALRTDGSVITWGNADAGGSSGSVAAQLNGDVDVAEVFSTTSAFAALRADGSVVTWGNPGTGGGSSPVADQLSGATGVVNIYSTLSSFAAVRSDGSVVTWGYEQFGGDSSAVAAQLNGAIDVVDIATTGSAFAAIRKDGSVVTWGNELDGGNSTAVATALNGTIDVASIHATTSAFAALRADGSVVTWGDVNNGGESSAVAAGINGTLDVSAIASSNSAFAALRTDGSVVTWGNKATGGDSGSVANQLDGAIDVTRIFANNSAFAALRADGSVTTWGNRAYGGDHLAVASELDGTIDVLSITANDNAFAALRTDGSVVAWGGLLEGGETSAVQTLLDGSVDVLQIFASSTAFSALRADGSVVTWGNLDKGGDSKAVAAQLNSVVAIASDLAPSGELVTGTAKVDPVVGSTGADYLSALAGNDILIGLAGNDSLDGGTGLDTAVYSNHRSGYTVTKPPGGLGVTGPEGADTLSGIERLHFADVTLAFDIDGNAGQTYRLYQAAFNRTPDLGGLGSWIHGMDHGVTLLQVATGFTGSAEFQSLYGANPTNGQFVNLLYNNVFHRAPDQGGFDYWVNQLASGTLTRDQVLVGFSESDENKTALLPAMQNGMAFVEPYRFTGSPAADVLIGTDSVDALSGLAGNDVLIGLGGNDSIDGGAGIDTSVYSGNRATHTVTRVGSSLTVAHPSGGDGTDTLVNVERLQFADFNLAFDTSGNAGQTYRLYQAAFDRTPDTPGLSYWINGMDGGMTLQTVASGFIGSAEFQGLYGANPSNTQFVDLLYANVLNRAPDAEGYDYWLGQMAGGMTRELVLIGFSESRENQAALIGVIQDGIAYSPV